MEMNNMEEKYYTEAELKEIFEDNERLFNSVYRITRTKYSRPEYTSKYGSDIGIQQARDGMYYFLTKYDTMHTTKEEGARDILKKFAYHGPEVEQFLLSYAISSFIANDLESKFAFKNPKADHSQVTDSPRKIIDFTEKEISAYSEENPDLDYSPEKVVAMVALGTSINTYWMVNVLSVNSLLKEALVNQLIKEMYEEGKRNFLNNARKTKIVKLKDGKNLMLSVSKLNKDIDNMIRADEGTYFKDDSTPLDAKGKEK